MTNGKIGGDQEDLDSQQKRMLNVLARWFDSTANVDDSITALDDPDWIRILPFISIHVMCFGVFWVGWSWTAILVGVGLYWAQMFAITAFYHRYFSHRSFRTSRWCQFIFALVGSSAVQRGPLWWAAHHRYHHRHSDEETDIHHSPVRHGFWWSHVGWLTTRRNFPSNLSAVPDLARYPELRWLDRYDSLVPALLAIALFVLGSMLDRISPSLGVAGPQLLVWGFFISTVVLLHATFTINSLAHVIGRRRFATPDGSRNSFLLALITLGEGWHNNHHRFPGSAQQGFYWWEIDVTYYVLRIMAWLGMIWDLKTVPCRVKIEGLHSSPD